MAKKKLNSIVWPNIPNDVYYLDADKVEYDDTETYSEGSVGDALQNKANIDGSYENLTAGNAEQIVTKIRANDQTPYLFRTSGGSVDIGDREYINGIVGGTVAWNQLAQGVSSGWENNGITYTANEDGSITINGTATANSYFNLGSAVTGTKDHVILLLGCPKGGAAGYSFKNGYTSSRDYGDGNISKNEDSSGRFVGQIYVTNGTTVSNLVFKPQAFDLTQMFGSTIADYIYSLEQATAGAGVAWFKKLFPKPYYAYNAGELISVKTSAHNTVGFNQFDKSTATDGKFVDASGKEVANANHGHSAIIPVLPSTTYYMKGYAGASFYSVLALDIEQNPITNFYGGASKTAEFSCILPSNCYYVILNYLIAQKDSVCFNLHWDGERDGEYEPYVKHSYPLDSSLTLRGIPKLDASNNLYYDGDTYESDGTVTRKYKHYLFDGSSDENWTLQSINDAGIANFGIIIDRHYSNREEYSICNKFERQTTLIGNTTTEGFLLSPNNLYIRINSTKANSVSALRTWLASNNIEIVYLLETPTTETADPYTSPQIVNDFGTEEFVISNTVAVPIPVGHNTDYPVNLKAKVEMMPNSPDGDGDYIVRQTNGTNEYVTLANNATIQNILSRLEALEGNNG